MTLDHDHIEQLALLGLEPALGTASTVELRLVTWNVQHAAPVRARRQVAWLAGRPEADVAVLTEVKDSPGGDALVQALTAHCYRAIVPAQAGGDYMTVVAARSHALEGLSSSLGFLPHRLVSARVEIGACTVGVAGLYVPSRGPRERRKLDKRAFQQAVSAYLAGLAATFGDGPVVVAGDLNVVEPDHQPRYSVFGDWEYGFYADFARLGGLVDAFRELHPGRVEHSWFGRGATATASTTSSSPTSTAASFGPAATSTSPAWPGSATTPPWPSPSISTPSFIPMGEPPAELFRSIPAGRPTTDWRSALISRQRPASRPGRTCEPPSPCLPVPCPHHPARSARGRSAPCCPEPSSVPRP